ncbi:hypothetical protein QJ854_gp133 [Moumouvirus goulette]|uniref:DUF5866 domain-containing protein n=1 Tax=Moumouvirus goulette TaxID=1247379 RepID=M1PCE8_9VIRU|nr:hypothetical protein QJ854_gp133 [Moumouvirus goulette]AGF85649.1 hypothetical protein glt_00844 [Moumouvirus goulette]
MLYIKSIDGLILTYNENILRDNIYIKNTLFEKVFFGDFKKENEIILNYSSDIIKYLIPYIRSGIIYFPKLSNPKEGFFDKNNHDIILNELVDMLNYIACGNEDLLLISNIFKKGAMDLFGRKISMCYQSFIDIKDLFYIEPYDEKLSIIYINNFIKGIIDNGGCNIKRAIDFQYFKNKTVNYSEIIFKILDGVKNHYFDPFNILNNEYFTKLNPNLIFNNQEQYLDYIIKNYASFYS